MVASNAFAWIDRWAPDVEFQSAVVTELPTNNAVRIARTFVAERDSSYPGISCARCGKIDLNGDKIDDFVFIIPWLGCGLAFFGLDAYFLVSDGSGGRVMNRLAGFGVRFEDLVNVNGKVYFRHSEFFSPFEKSNHNHWVYQMFAFGKDGVMRHANADFGDRFPAATIFYEKPKFKQIELTEADLEKIKGVTTPIAKIYE